MLFSLYLALTASHHISASLILVMQLSMWYVLMEPNVFKASQIDVWSLLSYRKTHEVWRIHICMRFWYDLNQEPTLSLEPHVCIVGGRYSGQKRGPRESALCLGSSLLEVPKRALLELRRTWRPEAHEPTLVERNIYSFRVVNCTYRGEK